MALLEAFDQATAKLKVLAEQLNTVAAQPIRVELAAAAAETPTTDRQEAEAIKRGQRPELLAAIRRSLGL